MLCYTRAGNRERRPPKSSLDEKGGPVKFSICWRHQGQGRVGQSGALACTRRVEWGINVSIVKRHILHIFDVQKKKDTHIRVIRYNSYAALGLRCFYAQVSPALAFEVNEEVATQSWKGAKTRILRPPVRGIVQIISADFDGIGAECQQGPHAVRHNSATPRSYEKRMRYEWAPLLTGIQLPRISTTVTKVPMTNKSISVAMTKVRRNKGPPYEGTPLRGIQVFKIWDINNTRDMFIV